MFDFSSISFEPSTMLILRLIAARLSLLKNRLDRRGIERRQRGRQTDLPIV